MNILNAIRPYVLVIGTLLAPANESHTHTHYHNHIHIHLPEACQPESPGFHPALADTLKGIRSN